tara:strand:+ start:338 stop:709 length:372 start_codon:yes stop_codon:yes gene_type:complete
MSVSANNRLKSSKAIDLLFSKGTYIKVSDYSLVYMKQKKENPAGLRVGFSVGKKTQPLAVERNKTKRILREAFRASFSNFFSLEKTFFNIMIVYNGASPPSFKNASEKLKSLLLSFSESITNG